MSGGAPPSQGVMAASPRGIGARNDRCSVEALTPERFADAALVLGLLLSTKGECFGMCRYSWCLPTAEQLGETYKSDPHSLRTTGVAVVDGKAVGVIRVSVFGRPKGSRSSDEEALHELRAGEAYVEYLSVTEEARGRGVGTALLRFAEAAARAEGATFMSLGVVRGNPALRLYERVGYRVVPRDCCDSFCTCCFVGCYMGFPHGRCGADEMEMVLDSSSP